MRNSDVTLYFYKTIVLFCFTSFIRNNVITCSNIKVRNPSDFDTEYGVLIADGPLKGLLTRSVVVINPEGKIVYTELVPEITQEPNYEAALAAIK